jgi:ubiquitin-like modifier-activating enzyme ATG7
MSVNKSILQYVQWKSMVSPDFWHKLTEIKLDVEKLEETEKEIHCSFSNYEGRNCLMEIDCTAFNK